MLYSIIFSTRKQKEIPLDPKTSHTWRAFAVVDDYIHVHDITYIHTVSHNTLKMRRPACCASVVGKFGSGRSMQTYLYVPRYGT